MMGPGIIPCADMHAVGLLSYCARGTHRPVREPKAQGSLPLGVGGGEGELYVRGTHAYQPRVCSTYRIYRVATHR